MEDSTLEEGSSYLNLWRAILINHQHPIDRHLFYNQETLFPAECVRLRIEIGHRLDSMALLLVLEEHDMPTRRQRRLELSGGPATRSKVLEIVEDVAAELGEWLSARLAAQEEHDPF